MPTTTGQPVAQVDLLPKDLNPEAINATKLSSQSSTTNKMNLRGNSNNSKNSNADSTRLRNSHPGRRRPAGRIDNADNNKEIATDHSQSSRGSASGSGSSSRSDDIRQKGKTVDRSGISARVAAHRQEENASAPGLHIPSSSDNKINANGTSRRQRRASHTAKFVHKVEEDRDLMEALTVGLTKSTYDCMVCWDVIRPAHKIWSCQVCWAAFHLDCLSTWAKKSSEGKNYRFCPCHPGPCPPCGGLGPIQSCYCGSESFQLRCVDTDFTFQSGKSCNQVCGELLGCGKHSCSSVCHPGLCSPCEEEQVQKCYCGKHERMARCGDGIPKATLIDGEEQTGYYECKYICKSEPCPPCTLLVTKQCMCRKSKMPSVPCYTTQTSCGKTCGKGLDCGSHKCNRSCHSGECTISPSEACSQSCLKSRKSCGHRCKVACHGQDPCPEGQPCQTLVVTSCKCGNLTKEIVCGASAENPWDGKPRIIKCNDFCLIAERNKRVALALDIDDSTIGGPRIPHFDDYVLDYASANMEFTLKIEKRLAEWVSDSTLQTLNLQPMKGHHRKFVHELASHYNVTSESVDVEPYRSVVIHKKLNTSVPDVLASQACRQRRSNTSTISTSGSGGGIEQLRKSNIKDPINAIYLHDLANGLTRAELSAQLAPIFGNIKYGIRWLTDDDAVLVPHPGNMSMDEFEILLVRLRTGIKSLVTNGQLCERVELCWMNKEGEVIGHTSVGQPKRFFNAAQGNQLLKKPAPPKVENTFSILDDDERVAAAKKAEEEVIMKAKEAAGTLSLEAWEEDANNSFSSSTQKTTRPPSAIDAYRSDGSFSSLKSKITRKADRNVVDDWQELLDDDVDDDQY
ncbi:FKBP12-associated protein [Entomortierella chlamydospora]|uniref:FKBP12-associated protein n=1 Tax=Entomortierella chlamydospora TaxID=101097 RepID=A0A9P6MX96_9FUNG|nr:FKBP12-associated protein [Entomortierella chlamydospora]